MQKILWIATAAGGIYLVAAKPLTGPASIVVSAVVVALVAVPVLKYAFHRRSLAMIAAGRLPPISAPIPAGEGECYYLSVPAQRLRARTHAATGSRRGYGVSLRIARSLYIHDYIGGASGARGIKAWELSDRGTLHVSNRRLLFLDSFGGVADFSFSKILQLNTDKAGIMATQKTGAPLFVATEAAPEIKTFLAALKSGRYR